ncbi:MULTISPECIES: winged helix-turn-helix transcriptional regulator [unclassified Crossiella]|uniref:winged helix-turn-helix transcriptional regulator n=1 Tax=unclassified Crossiella TaxID=2620835 RepID=UPI001FFF3018|nr:MULTISPECIES: winged helix-turn-helix transcriptional regulator [unclassified Crossiella]MCK2240906.1 winged helix-turn-helix transcriptional regulator [Crossiella sp. S99.2]MCK2253950.1 winged helix-turn-helix transcriptional regulator [Crossiella sp. S99.1]
MADNDDGWPHMAEISRKLAGEWVVPVLAVLSKGPLRYTRLASRIRHAGPESGRPEGERVLHDRTLTNTLRSMEARGLVRRHEIDSSVPPVVVYELTDAARSLIATMRSIGK